MTALRATGYIGVAFGFALSVVAFVDAFYAVSVTPLPVGMPILVYLVGLIALAVDDIRAKA